MSSYIPQSLPVSQDSGTIKQLSAPIYQAKGWLKLLGVLSIIGGIFAVLTLVGLISGGLSIWMGVLLYQAGSSTEPASQMGDRYAFLRSMNNLKTYFTIRGILMLISIIFAVIAICVLIVLPLLGVIPFLINPDIINNL